jgi:RNA polymerase sigma factor (TIGR02999 family)
MEPDHSAHVTGLLVRWREGDEDAGGQVIEAVYRELRRVASVYLSRESGLMTLQPTALVNDLCVNMLSGSPVSCENRLHFLHLAARQMRRLIVDYVRRRTVQKRGGYSRPVSLDEAHDHSIEVDDRVAAVNSALTSLERLDARAAAVVEMRYFGGLTEQEIGDILLISTATVKRDWEFARSWLLAQLKAGQPPSHVRGSGQSRERK